MHKRHLTLYEITNGFTGYSYVRCLVIADSESAAIVAARPVFEADESYSDTYVKNLKARVLCVDVSHPWVGEVTE